MYLMYNIVGALMTRTLSRSESTFSNDFHRLNENSIFSDLDNRLKQHYVTVMVRLHDF